MKTPSEEIFNIIKSLTSQEKRFFRLYVQQNAGQSNYSSLFDAIDALEAYDEKKLSGIFVKKGHKNGLKKVKSYLQEALFRFFEYYYSDCSVEVQLQRQLQRIEVLYGKRLFASAEKHIVRAWKMALAHHLYLHLLNIQGWKRKIMLQKSDTAAFAAYEKVHYSLELHYMDLYRNVIEYQKIYLSIAGFLTIQVESIDEKANTALREILKDPFLQDEKMALSFPAKVIYHRILGDISLMQKKWEGSYQNYHHAVAYSEPAKLSTDEKIMLFSRLVKSLRELKKGDELLVIKDKAVNIFKTMPRKLLTKNTYGQYLSLMNNYISYQLYILDADEALSASQEVLELVEKNARVDSFIVFYFNLFLIYFLKADYRKALFCANKVLSVEKTEVRKDVISYMKFLHLLIHYELGNEEMLPNLCKSAASSLSKKRPLDKSEKILLNFFGKTIIKDSNKSEKINLFANFKKNLKKYKIEKDIEFFDFISWAESKIQNRPFIDIMKEKIH